MFQPRYATGVLPIQLAVAHASPSSWEDVVVTGIGDGWIETVNLHDSRSRSFMTSAVTAIGEPIAIHPVAELLSVGSERFAARPTN